MDGEVQLDTSWHEAFLKVYGATGILRAALEAAGVDRETFRLHMRALDGFRAAVRGALDDAVDLLEAEAVRRARLGSDALLMFMLRAYRPKRFREPKGGGTTINNNVGRTADPEVAEAALGAAAGAHRRKIKIARDAG